MNTDKFGIKYLTLAGIIAALYMLLTLPFAQFSYGIIQFRLAEILTVLPILNFAAVPGVFVGCFLVNLLNPHSLGLVDIIGGSLATLLAAWLSYRWGTPWRLTKDKAESRISLRRLVPLVPPIIVNALIVGTYLPYLLLDQVTVPTLLGAIGSIALTQSLVIFLLGLPLLLALQRTGRFNKESS